MSRISLKNSILAGSLYRKCLLFGFGAASLLTMAGCGGGGGSGSSSGSSTTETREVSVTIGTNGSRGTIPATVQVSGASPRTTTLTGSGQTLTAAQNASVLLTAPDGYADRQFVGWQQGGSTVAATTALNLSAGSLATGSNLTAVYTARTMPDGGFAPNYSRSEFPHWKQFPVNVFLNSTVTAEKKADIQTGLDRWVAATGGLVSYVLVSDAAQADVTIGFGDTPSGTAGLCDTTWDGTNAMKTAAITLNPPQTGATTTTPQNLPTLACHEFGHALGLTGAETGAGHSLDPGDTMYVTGNSTIGVISQRDIDTLANVYPALFGGVNRSEKSHQSDNGTLHHARVF